MADPIYPPATYTPSGTQYVAPAELHLYAMSSRTLNQIPFAVLQAACVGASGRADSYMRSRYPLPLVTYDTDIKQMVAWIAIYTAISGHGYDPEKGLDEQIEKRYQEAIAYFQAIQRQTITPNVTFRTPNSPQYDLPAVLTNPARGWEPTGSGSSRGGFPFSSRIFRGRNS